MILGIREPVEAALMELNKVLAANEQYSAILPLPSSPGESKSNENAAVSS